MGKSERDKGARGEREFCKAWNALGYTPVERGCQRAGGPDSPDAKGLDGVHFEVKRVEKLNLHSAMKQAEGDCGSSIPVVAHKRNHGKWMLTLAVDDLPLFIERVLQSAAQPNGGSYE